MDRSIELDQYDCHNTVWRKILLKEESSPSSFNVVESHNRRVAGLQSRRELNMAVIENGFFCINTLQQH